MKKQNGMNKLAFNKAAVTELNDQQLQDVNGASTPMCYMAFAIIYTQIVY